MNKAYSLLLIKLLHLLFFSVIGSYYAYIYPVFNPVNNKIEFSKVKVNFGSGDFEIVS